MGKESTLIAAERYAETVCDELGLQPPIPIEELVRARARIKEEVLPNGVEAVVIERGLTRPTVYLSETLHPARRRFTLAHEYGHIVLPWQIGSMACNPDVGDGHEYSDRFAETEANRFAAELLLPRSWLAKRVNDFETDPAEALAQIAETAGVSPITAAIRIEHIDKARIGAAVRRSNGSVYRGSGARFPYRNIQWWTDDTLVERSGARLSRLVRGSYELCVVVLPETYREVTRPVESSKSLLLDILRDAVEGVNWHAKVNGVVGAANSASKGVSVAEKADVLRHAFVRNAELRWFIEHSTFEDFLSAKAHELCERLRDEF